MLHGLDEVRTIGGTEKSQPSMRAMASRIVEDAKGYGRSVAQHPLTAGLLDRAHAHRIKPQHSKHST